MSVWSMAIPDTQIIKAFPAIEFIPYESNGLYQEIREISGDLWIVTNAMFNPLVTEWFQSTPADPVQSAYALVLRANGFMQRYAAVPTQLSSTPVNWGAPVWGVDAQGNFNPALPGITLPKTGTLSGVLVDGSAPGIVTFSQPFGTSIGIVQCTVLNDYVAHPWAPGAPQVKAKTLGGFQVFVEGGPSDGSTVSIDYLVYGT